MVRNKKSEMRFKYYKSMCFAVFLFVTSCEFFDHRYKYKLINSNTEIDINVAYVESKNGLLINNKYYYGGGSLLQNKNDGFPEWLFKDEEMINMVAYYNDEEELLTEIIHIRPPYQIYKKANSNIMYLVKNNDTLKFITF